MIKTSKQMRRKCFCFWKMRAPKRECKTDVVLADVAMSETMFSQNGNITNGAEIHLFHSAGWTRLTCLSRSHSLRPFFFWTGGGVRSRIAWFAAASQCILNAIARNQQHYSYQKMFYLATQKQRHWERPAEPVPAVVPWLRTA